jgi:hypothetical protein
MNDMTDKIVDFLIKENSLRLGGSPWPSLGLNDDSGRIDWKALFPRSRPGRDGNEWDLYGDDSEWNPEFSEEWLQQIDDAFGKGPPESREGWSNWDVCAWYQPVHFFGHDWGIFIREDCARRLAVWIARFMKGTPAQTGHSRNLLAKALLRAAIYAYFLHEHYHHKVECLGLRLHVVDRTSRYLPYHAKVYRQTANTDDQLEESLANADMFNRLSDPPYRHWLSDPVLTALRAYLGWSFPHDPPGYRQAPDFLHPYDFDAGENLLQGQVKEADLTPVQPASDWDIAQRLLQSIFPVKSDIWTVLPPGSKSILPLQQAAPVRTCSTDEMIKLYAKAGYQIVDGGKGSHVKLAKPGAATMILPGDRRELSPGVAKTAVRVLGDFTLRDLPGLLTGRLQLPGGSN